MTKWQEFPRRPQGRPWPGINTRAGVLDDGSGQLKDDSTNVMIHEGDVLEKRPGMVRGLDEFFDGAVCGLHRYTDECGIEYLLVSDQLGIKIRQPFSVPVFEVSDAYPFDAFEGSGFLDVTRWNNRTFYQQTGGELRLINADAPDPVVWFKEAASSSYQMRIQFRFDPNVASDQKAKVIWRAGDSTATNARLEAEVLFTAGSVDLLVSFWSANGLSTTLASVAGGTAEEGTLTVGYNADTRRVAIEFFPTLGTATVTDTDAITAVQEQDLGLYSALQLENLSANMGILVVDGGPI